MRRVISIFLAVSLLLTGCGARTLSAESGSESAYVNAAVLEDLPDAQDNLSESESASESENASEAESPSVSESSAASTAASESAPASSAKAPDTSTAPSEAVSASSQQEKPSQPSQASSSASQSVSESVSESASESTAAETKKTSHAVSGEVRGVWISYLEFLGKAQNKSRAEFSAMISDMFETAADFGLNTVFVQVRPFGDALYSSGIFPWSYVLTGTEGEAPGYDPLAVMVSAARAEGLRIEAWINPYRVRAAGSSRALSDDNPAVKSLSSGDGTAIAYNGGVFYNPASQAARDLITEGVVEIIKNYDIDGIHFDDYFYPTTDTAFDSADYAAYKSGGGTLALADWRRENVTKLVRQVYNAIKNTDSSVLFGISPQARMDVNYNTQYADVAAWAGEGIVDYLCPQIYFGFDHATQPFATRADEWEKLVRGTGVTLYIGLAAYKCGVTDNYAGDAGKNEWTQNDDILAQMVEYSREKSGYGGFVIYRYDSLFSPESSLKTHIAAERENLHGLIR